ncbi:MAG: site-specific integrase, partial [Anaerolineae bacterium]|nr:site-specific integrase [Anaerolineae bacterium]
AITTINQPTGLEVAGQAANEAAGTAVFADYLSRKADNTISNQATALGVFAAYLTAVGVTLPCVDFQHDPACWQGVTWGIVEGFVKWQLTQGYSIASINNRLAHVKTYAKLATKAGAIPAQEYAMIRLVQGYGGKEAKRIDERRPVTRIGHKKGAHVPLTAVQARQLKTYPDTPQGRRDTLLMCLLLDHGLRVGEVAGLNVADFDLAAGELRFYRPKVDKLQTHKLTADTLRAAVSYFEHDAPKDGRVLRGSAKGGALTGGMSMQAIKQRVAYLGQQAGIDGLSPHDCRHYWATYWADKVSPFRLQEAGGWASLEMPRRYVEAAAVANEGMA